MSTATRQGISRARGEEGLHVTSSEPKMLTTDLIRIMDTTVTLPEVSNITKHPTRSNSQKPSRENSNNRQTLLKRELDRPDGPQRKTEYHQIRKDVESSIRNIGCRSVNTLRIRIRSESQIPRSSCWATGEDDDKCSGDVVGENEGDCDVDHYAKIPLGCETEVED